MSKTIGHLQNLFDHQKGCCFICGKPAVLDFESGKAGQPESAVRFRLGSSYGKKGRVRKRVMAHRKCAQERSDQITTSLPIEEQWHRSHRHPSEFYQITKPTE